MLKRTTPSAFFYTTFYQVSQWFVTIRRAILLALVLISLDQGTKFAAFALENRNPIIVIPNFFELCFVINYGASWGILQGQRWLLTAFASVALALLIVFCKHVFKPTQPLPALTLALFLGGIAGNLLDRTRIGGVIDFIHLHWYTHSFPVFNVADMCITFGLVFYLIGQFAAERVARDNAKKLETQNMNDE